MVVRLRFSGRLVGPDGTERNEIVLVLTTLIDDFQERAGLALGELPPDGIWDKSVTKTWSRGHELKPSPKVFSGARSPGRTVVKGALRSPSCVLRRIAYSIEPFDLKLPARDSPPPLLKGQRDGLWQQPGMFSQVDDRQANKLQ